MNFFEKSRARLASETGKDEATKTEYQLQNPEEAFFVLLLWDFGRLFGKGSDLCGLLVVFSPTISSLLRDSAKKPKIEG